MRFPIAISITRREVRAFLPLVLGLVMIPIFRIVQHSGIDYIRNIIPFGWALLGITLLYVAAAGCFWFDKQEPGTQSRSYELAAIVGIGVAMRMIFWGDPPTLSHDAFRYVWDAHLVAHGISPYLHTPLDHNLVWLRDSAIWPAVNWRDAPTIYPPGAQLFFLAIDRIAPLNIFALKAGIAICDIGSGFLMWVVLRQRQIDPRLIAIYWWSPIPVLEFAWSAHIDAVALVFTLGAVIVAQTQRKNLQINNHAWFRHPKINDILIGILLGLATLTKLYPLLFVIIFWRRKSLLMPATLMLSVLLGYLLFVPLGLGSGGSLGTYFSQRFVDQGLVLRFLSIIVVGFGGSQHLLIGMQFFVLAGLLLAILWWHWKYQISHATGILLITLAWILVAPHLFPWYIAGTLPFVVVTMTEQKAIALSLWALGVLMPFTYIIFAPGNAAGLFWIFLLIPIVIFFWPLLRRRNSSGIFAASG